jgi:hypothetical protein
VADAEERAEAESRFKKAGSGGSRGESKDGGQGYGGSGRTGGALGREPR